MTFFRRGSICVSALLAEFDHDPPPAHFVSTAPVVPDPANKSSTRSPGFVAISIMRLRRRSGLGVEKICPYRRELWLSFFASSVCPVSSCGHHVFGTIADASLRNCLNDGAPSPSLPKIANPASTIAAIDLQYATNVYLRRRITDLPRRSGNGIAQICSDTWRIPRDCSPRPSGIIIGIPILFCLRLSSLQPVTGAVSRDRDWASRPK